MALNFTPNASDRISETQGPIRQNFITINDAFDVNHGEYNTGDQGKHKFITFPVQNPAPTITYPDVGLYSFANALTGKNELYYVNSNNTPSSVPFTASSYTGVGWSLLPSGILLKWGQTTAIGVGATLLYTIPSGSSSTGPAFAFPGGILHVQLTPLSGAANNVSVVFLGTTGVSNQISIGSSTGAASGAAYFVIGFANSY